MKTLVIAASILISSKQALETNDVHKNTITVTPRQSQIVDLILERGLSNKKIAQALNITESTVKIHVSAILKAYGVRTRTQLVVSSYK
jgi:DNA-binding NarL/FixJ family response regulator